MGLGLRRATLFVRDLVLSQRFYQTAFGLSVYRALDVDLSRVPDFPVGPGGPATGQAKLVILRGSDPLVGMVGLMQMIAPELPDARYDVRRLGAGSVALVLAVGDADAAAMAVAAHGGEIIQPVKNARNIGDAAGEFTAVKMFMAYDPDGHFLEVFQPL